MKRFTDAGRKSIKDDNLYSALSIALMIPDICGSLEDPGPGKSKARYITWYTKWVLPKFTSGIGPSRTTTVFISADDCFQLRCSLIHSGSAEIEPGKQSALDRFIFFDKTSGSHLNLFSNVLVDGVKMSFLQLRADAFSETMFAAADEWDAAVEKDAKIQAEKAKLLVIRSAGFTIGKAGIEFR
jgi:hypothetical protein